MIFLSLLLVVDVELVPFPEWGLALTDVKWGFPIWSYFWHFLFFTKMLQAFSSSFWSHTLFPALRGAFAGFAPTKTLSQLSARTALRAFRGRHANPFAFVSS
jgi:hypothetical protein